MLGRRSELVFSLHSDTAPSKTSTMTYRVCRPKVREISMICCSDLQDGEHEDGESPGSPEQVPDGRKEANRAGNGAIV